jgi:hypothetical protein
MRSRGIWLKMLIRGVQLNSLTALNAGTTAPISYTQCLYQVVALYNAYQGEITPE